MCINYAFWTPSRHKIRSINMYICSWESLLKETLKISSDDQNEHALANWYPFLKNLSSLASEGKNKRKNAGK